MYPDILNYICLTVPIVVFFDRPHHTLLTLALRIWARSARLISNVGFSIMLIFTSERVFRILLLWIQLRLSSLEIRVRGLIVKWFTCFINRLTFLFGGIVALVLFKELLLTSFVLVLFGLVIILAQNVILLGRTSESWLRWDLLKCWRHWLSRILDTLLATLFELLFGSRILPWFSRVVIHTLSRLVVPIAVILLPSRNLFLLWTWLFLLRLMALIRSWRIKALRMLRWLLRHNCRSSNLRLMTAYGLSSMSFAQDFGVILIFVDVALIFVGDTILWWFLSRVMT